MRFVRSVFDAAVGFIYPPQCPFCGIPAGGQTRRSVSASELCRSCRDLLTPKPTPSCGRCGAPVGPYLDTEKACIHCRRDRFAFQSVIRLGVYEGPLKHACLRMKREYGAGLAAACGFLLWEEAAAALRTVDADVVVPVPGHWSGRFRRSDNAAESVAARLAACLHVPISRHILRKVRKTSTQASLRPNERRTNLRNAFRASIPGRLQGGIVLLVDDVLTTGATAHEATSALKKAGAARVFVAVLARGLGQ